VAFLIPITIARNPQQHITSCILCQGPFVEFIQSEESLDPNWHPEEIEAMDWKTNFKVGGCSPLSSLLGGCIKPATAVHAVGGAIISAGLHALWCCLRDDQWACCKTQVACNCRWNLFLTGCSPTAALLHSPRHLNAPHSTAQPVI
jgi:hypothetical protein